MKADVLHSFRENTYPGNKRPAGTAAEQCKKSTIYYGLTLKMIIP